MSAMRAFALETAFGTLAGLRAGRAGAPRVLALHGWLDNAASFVPLSAHLPDIDLVAIDMPGHGASAHLPAAADYLLIAFLRAAFAAADALGWERFSLLGHSLGGVIASLMASAQPRRIERLLTIEALGALTEAEERTTQRLRDALTAYAALPGKQLRVFPDVATAIRARLRAGTGDLGEAAATLLVERGLRAVDGGFVWRSDPRLTMPTAVRMSEAQSRDLVAHIECPTRVIYAEPAQTYFPEALRRERAGLLRHGELIVMPGSHHLHMDDAPGVAAAIGDFFHAS
ncbi:pimeloyl-ACP methyl ester carboxylesterase [Lysobacter niabensis]|uniref:Pimeloyl-ACP methyl ester carboxylesterase n=2 Tax=Agrilutibacter niabensis TaxID=380628 RepID=A0ABU1VRI0_9GAMM|nr:pimeloyl-ACP methyl ester carboxylesterase [Lysobacter niabensis]